MTSTHACRTRPGAHTVIANRKSQVNHHNTQNTTHTPHTRHKPLSHAILAHAFHCQAQALPVAVPATPNVDPCQPHQL